MVECRECRLIRLYPRPSPREIKDYYPDNYWFDPPPATADQLAEVWRRFVLRDHVRFVRRALDDSRLDGPVLDVGCGGGLFLRELDLPQNRVVGLDFSVDAARSPGPPTACRWPAALCPARPSAALPSPPSRCSTCWSISTTRPPTSKPRTGC